MMRGFFPRYIEYGNEGSESVANEKVVILRKKEMEEFYPRNKENFWGDHAVRGMPGWNAFNARLHASLTERVQPGDFVAHPFGQSHVDVVQKFPQAIHIETGIGYPDAPFGAFRVYESWAWAHSHWGRWGVAGLAPVADENRWEDPGCNRTYSWVIPNYFDLEEWPVGKGTSGTPYVLFMGRIAESKGIAVLATIIRAWCDKHGLDKLHFVIAGQGDWTPYGMILQKQSAAVRYVGPVHGKARAPLVGRAVASLMPTQFIEPFGGSGVEGLLCGTPLLASAWGAFTETVTPGVNGYQCRTLGDWVLALENVLDGSKLASRREIARAARERYSLEACREKYAKIFGQLLELRHGQGAMSLKPFLWEKA